MNLDIKFNNDKKRGPTVAIVGCLHGDELIGKKVIKELRRKIKLKRGRLITIIANEKAIKKKKRFIEQDLNRSFPGNKRGNYEEKLAYDILKIAKKADFVIDIHSTITDSKDLAIITKTNKKVLNLIGTIKPKRVALMNRGVANKAFIDYCTTAVSLEYGRDKNKKTYDNTIKSVTLLLSSLKMIKAVNYKKKGQEIEFYKIKGAVKKIKNFYLNKDIENFKLIKKDTVLACNEGDKIYAKKDFYPILFDDKSYENIFGFEAIKKELFDKK